VVVSHSETRLLESSLVARLDAARRRLFVGRDEEIRLATLALEESSALSVLLVSGETGVGKSMLLEQMATLAAERGSPSADVDAATLVSASSGLLEATLRDLQMAAAEVHRRPVLFVDNFDAIGPREPAFLRRIMARVPPRTLIVLAARRDLGALQLEESGFVAPLFRHVRLGPLEAGAADDYLRRRQIREEARAGILQLCHGNPLLLSLATRFGGGPPTSMLPEVVEPLALSRLGSEVAALLDSEAKRTAIATLVLTRATVHELLSATMGGGAEVDATYAWLGQLSFVDHSRIGLHPHHVARIACQNLLRREHPSLCSRVVARARAFHERQIRSSFAPQRWLADRLFLEMDLPESFSGWGEQSDGGTFTEEARSQDQAPLVAMARGHEGESTASRVERAVTTNPRSVDVLRSLDGAARAFSVCVEVRGLADPAEIADPAMRIVRAHLARLRWDPAGDARAFVFRDWMTEITHQAPSPYCRLLVAQMASRLLVTPQIRFHFGIAERRDAWLEPWRALGFDHELLGSYADGGRDIAVFAYDWQRHASASGRGESSRTAGHDAHAAKPPELGALMRDRLAELADAARLTAREKEVLDLVVLGRNAGEIGQVLEIAARTAKFHQSRMLAKLGADSRMDLFRLLL